jgi:hypothetical protein
MVDLPETISLIFIDALQTSTPSQTDPAEHGGKCRRLRHLSSLIFDLFSIFLHGTTFQGA